MPKKQESKTTVSTQKTKKLDSTQIKKLKKLVEGEEPKKVPRKSTMRTKKEIEDGHYQANAKNIEKATIYEVNVTLNVTTRLQNMNVTLKERKRSPASWKESLDRAVTVEQIVDKVKRQIIKSGTLNLTLREKTANTPPQESVQGIDAIDVELLLQLFGVAE